MKISDIIYKEEYILSEINDDTKILGICTKEIDVKDGYILLIPNSKNYFHNDNAHLPIAVICDKDAIVPNHIPKIYVDNARIAISNAYMRFYRPDMSKTLLIGVTGTNGKTSTATIIENILSQSGKKVGFIGTGRISVSEQTISPDFYSMTTPDPEVLYPSLRRMTDEKCDAIVMEVSSHALAFEKVAPLFFDYALYTNLSSEHRDFHANMDDYFNTKAKLFQNCKSAFINIDCPYGKRLAKICQAKKITTTGILWRGDIYVRKIESKGFDGSSYIYYNNEYSFKVNLALPGIFNIYNSLLAVAVCIDAGVAPCFIKKYLSNISSIPGRFEIIKDKITVIIDYAHTDEAFNNILKELSKNKKSSITVVFGCGGNRDREKRPKIATITEKYADKLIVTSDNSRSEDPKNIFNDIISGLTKNKHIVIEDRATAIEYAILNAKDNDIVALIGKGHEKYNIDKNGYHPFDEKALVKEALKKRNITCE